MNRMLRALGKRALYYAKNPRQLIRPDLDGVHTTRFGARMVCSHEYYIERTIMEYGIFEERSTKVVIDNALPGQIAFDVGANVGYYTLLLAKCVGSAGQVHAFEPTAWAHERCVHNLGLNPDLVRAQVSCNRTGLLAGPRVSVERIESQFSAKTLAYRAAERMEFTTIDAYCMERGIKAIDFMKVDVDGYDVEVILGARSTLGQGSTVLLLELCERELRARSETLARYVDVLEELGYVHGEVLDGPQAGTRRLKDLVGLTDEESGGSCNVLTRRGRSN